MVRKLLAVGAVLCLVALPSPAADDTGDKDKLKGSWEMTVFEIGGQKLPIPEGKGMLLVFDGDKFTKKEPGKKDETGTFKIDEKKKLREIDLTVPKEGGKDGETMVMKGLYEIDGDTLRLSFGMKPDGPRPTALDSKGGVLMTLKKKK
jgi:uncharacterized protein (TIGR03067 family)